MTETESVTSKSKLMVNKREKRLLSTLLMLKDSSLSKAQKIGTYEHMGKDPQKEHFKPMILFL